MPEQPSAPYELAAAAAELGTAAAAEPAVAETVDAESAVVPAGCDAVPERVEGLHLPYYNAPSFAILHPDGHAKELDRHEEPALELLEVVEH